MKNKITFLLALGISLLFLSSLSDAQSTVSIRLGPTTGEDCLLLSNFPNLPLPTHPDLAGLAGTVLGNYFAGRSLFRFNLSSIPVNSTVLNARLSLFANPTPSNNPHDGENKSFLRKVTTPWSANTVTFDTPPDFSYINQVELPQSISPTQDYLNINVTSLVIPMISDPSNNYGFSLALRLEGIYRSMNFASSDCPDTSKRPLLIITYDEPLAVELSSFTSSTNGRNISLKWTTSSEENNSGFEILRSASNDNSEYTKVAFIHGYGTTNSVHNYSFEDRNLTSGKFKYKLKQIDFNGNFKYYELSNDVEVGIPAVFSLYQNYPNPFNPTTKINFDIAKDGFVSLKIFDIQGREIKKLVNEYRKAGFYTEEFKGLDLASGAYYYKIESGDFSSTKDMILIK